MRYQIIVAVLLAAAPALAQSDFSAGSEANEWGLFGEQKAPFTGRVTDAVCALTGACPSDCGGGLRQMVILREADGVMVLVAKNGQLAFSGAILDLAPYCNRTVEVDGVFVGDPEITPAAAPGAYYMVQRIRADGSAEWQPADRFTSAWEDRHPEAAGEGPWFRRDPAIQAIIEESGCLGLGLDVDAAFI